MAKSKSGGRSYSRRGFIAAGLAAPALAGTSGAMAPQQRRESPTAGPSTMLQVDFQKLVSRADLTYDKPVSRSEENMPVGNGRMGSLVWTTPGALRFQINRAGVYPISSNTNSFPRADADYASGCGYLDIHVVDFGDDVLCRPGVPAAP